MADKTNGLETKLNDIFVKNAPKLPDGGKKALVEWAPIISLVVGVLTLLSAWSLWHWARLASNASTYYIGQICSVYHCGTPPVSRFSVWLWLGVVSLAAEGLLYVFAYSGLKEYKKQGWDYLYYGALLNVAYAVVSLFASYDIVGHFVGALIGSAIGFYLLFQIRESYLGSKKKPVAPIEPPK